MTDQTLVARRELGELLDALEAAAEFLDAQAPAEHSTPWLIHRDVLREAIAALSQPGYDMPNPRQPLELNDGMAATPPAGGQEAIRALIAKWRKTAQIWEDQELGRGAYHGSPVGNGKGNIKNWCNWLRGCANNLEAALSQEPAAPVKEEPR